MDWFLPLVFQILGLLLYAVVFFGSLAAISGVGFCLQSGFQRATSGRWGGAILRWAYSLIVGPIIILILLAARIDWWLWLIVIGLMVLGFFGVFAVPGEGD
jgi:hypothetical protein